MLSRHGHEREEGPWAKLWTGTDCPVTRCKRGRHEQEDSVQGCASTNLVPPLSSWEQPESSQRVRPSFFVSPLSCVHSFRWFRSRTSTLRASGPWKVLVSLCSFRFNDDSIRMLVVADAYGKYPCMPASSLGALDRSQNEYIAAAESMWL